MNKLLTTTAATCLLALGGLASLSSGCGDIQITPSQQCTPGELTNCFCEDNSTGKALCGPDGAPGTCQCTSGADGGADASGGDVAVTGCEPGTECDDGDPCTDGDLCRADRTCQGTAKSCDDGRACTVDGCDASTGQCLHDPSPCGCQSDGDCDDGDPCTEDSCDTTTGTCTQTPIPGCGAECMTDAECDDGDPCTDDSCDPAAGGCYHGPIAGCATGCTADAECDDGDPCTDDWCDHDAAGCDHTAIPNCGATCDGSGGVFINCDDGDPCTDDWCDPAAGGCIHTLMPSCGAECMTDAECDDGDPCTHGWCDITMGQCVFDPSTCGCTTDADCAADGDTCTADICMSGVCEYAPQGSHYHFEAGPGGGFDSSPELGFFLDPNSGFTIEMWVQLMPDQASSGDNLDGWMPILDAMDGPFDDAAPGGFAVLADLTTGPGFVPRLAWWQGNAPDASVVYDPPLGAWFHLAVTCTASGELFTWIDGTDVTGGSPQQCTPSAATMPWSWAWSPDEPPQSANGPPVWLDGLVLLDNVQISVGMHHAPGEDFEPPLLATPDDSTVAIYGFEDAGNSGQNSVFDSGPHGLDGTIVGGSFEQPGYPPCP